MRITFLILLITLTACNRRPTNIDENDKFSELKISIELLIKNTIDADTPGAAVLVAYDSVMIFGDGFGLADLENKRPIKAHTNMRMGSVSKQFTALCILDLEAKGLLSLADSLTAYWPYPVFKDIKISNLLNHTSGLADYEAYFMNRGDSSKIIVNQDVLDWLATNPVPSFKSGEGWEYSNTAYIILALIVEKISGEEFSAYAKEHIFEKANMENTNFYSLANPIQIYERAFCYEIDSLKQWKKVDGYFMNGVMGDGALYTSVNDYFNYAIALRNNSIISSDLHDRLFERSKVTMPKDRPFFKFLEFAGQELYYTNGWFRNENLAFHSGSWFGTRTFVIYDLNRPLTIAVFLNSNLIDKRNKLVNEIFRLVDACLRSNNIK